MPASVFKAKCLSMLDDVAASGESIVVTKHGRPVARVVPIDEPEPTMGSVLVLADDENELFSTGESWGVDA